MHVCPRLLHLLNDDITRFDNKTWCSLPLPCRHWRTRRRTQSGTCGGPGAAGNASRRLRLTEPGAVRYRNISMLSPAVKLASRNAKLGAQRTCRIRTARGNGDALGICAG